jgi:O-antigen/teichoic acid export membrane protein
MRLGQTAAIYFLGKLGSSVLGFLATVYFARKLGAGVLGVYFLSVAVVSWLVLGSKMGFNDAVAKRVSEGEEKDRYISAGLAMSLGLYLFISVLIFLTRDYLNGYLGTTVYHFVLLMFGAKVLDGFINAVMRGEHLVHLQGIQNFLGTLTKSALQILFVFFGFGLVGMLVGYIMAFFAVTVVGVAMTLRYVERMITLPIPEKKHFRSLFDYAKYSWMGRFEARTYSWTDIVILGFFVPSNLVGIYGVCWTLSTVMTLFSSAISNTMFPEVSKYTAEDDTQAAAGYLNDALAYTGLFTIPGLVGAILVGDGVLNTYSEEFSRGHLILVLLIGAVLLHSYQKQFLNVLNAVDRPDLSFRINAVFVSVNIVFNFVLIYLYGWVGAAVATLFSSFTGLLMAYWTTSRIIEFTLPRGRILEQSVAAVSMGLVVYAVLLAYGRLGIPLEDIVATVAAIAVGAGMYFLSMLYISEDFQRVVRNNAPL